MGSVSNMNPGVSDLLQTLSNLNSPVLSSQPVVNALENAPPADIVQLSMAATQLESVNAMFGIAATPSTGMDTSTSSTLGALEGTAPSSSVVAAASPLDQNANAQAALQAELSQGLFGTGTSNGVSGSLFDTIG
jgi:hypothetical protein